MDIKVGLSVYNKPWLIEPNAALNLLSIFERALDNEITYRAETEDERAAYLQFQKLFARQDVVFAPRGTWESDEFKGFEGARTAIIPIEGPLMKFDFCGDFGTASLASLFRLADNTPSIESIILLIDSPGGMVDGTAAFAEVIKNSKKATLSVVDGMACSAAYWLGSSAQEVICTTKTDEVGSIGTMVSWYDQSKRLEANGIVLKQFFASKSTDKNRAFREANAGDGRMLVQDHLDPVNNEFLLAVKSNRAGKINLDNEDVLTGKTYLAAKAKAVGLIDNITSFDKAISRSLQLAKEKNKIKMSATVAFPRVLKAANAPSFDLVDNIGFGLTEQHLRSLEQALADAETNATNLQNQLNTASAATSSANEALIAAQTEISGLKTQIENLKKGPAAPFQQTAKTGTDEIPNAPAKTIHSITEEANKLRAMRGLPAIK